MGGQVSDDPGVSTVNEENKSGASAENTQSSSEDKMQALLDQRMKRYKTVAKYIGVGAALYVLIMVWYMMHQ